MLPSLTNTEVATYEFKNIQLLSKDEVIKLLVFLSERINGNYIMMGGLLYTIRKNKWFDPSPTFADFCDSRVGIHYRRAMYMIQIYESLVTNQIPFEAVADLGFTKLTLISTHLTFDNYKNLIEWAKGLTTQEIENELKNSATKAKGFIEKVKANEVLAPDYKEKTVKKVVGSTPELKQLLTVTPVELVVQALNLLYPDKEFVIA